jgi:beta-lactamase class A
MRPLLELTPRLLMVIALAASAENVRAADDPLAAVVGAIEDRHDNRVGVMVVDTGSNRRWEHRADERFPLTSTFKAFACAALLARHSSGALDAGREIPVTASDLVTYSPVLETRVDARISLSEACDAMMTVSDNGAANIVLDALGGPTGLTAFMRQIGDFETRLDRRETALNAADPGDPRDTTTPRAAANSLRALLLGDALPPDARNRLEAWMLGNAVGGPLLRAGLPADWRVADRTGAGGHGSRAVIAVLWPPTRDPIVAAVFMTGRDLPMETRNAAVAGIGAAIARWAVP